MISRRTLLQTIGGGFGGIAIAQLLAREALSEVDQPKLELNGG